MEEIVDVFDEVTGKKTGKIIKKSEAHKKGIWHSSVHLLIVNKEKNKILLQKRCQDKALFANMWDIAVGGHISTGETGLISVKRELEEELGLNPDDYDIQYLTTVKEIFEDNGIISKEFVNSYIVYDNIDISNITLQKEEVSEVNWFTKEELNNLIKEKQIIPHNEEYKILNKILKD